MDAMQIEHCKEQLQRYVESITELSRGSRAHYNCPLCPSGTGDKRTGAFSIKDNRYKCFSCGESGDIFDLIAAVEGLEPQSRAVFVRAGELLNVSAENIPTTKGVNKNPMNEAPKRDYREYIEQCAAALKGNQAAMDYLTGERGLSSGSMERFGIGYDPNFSFYKVDGGIVNNLGAAIIIPSVPGGNHFSARLLNKPDWFNNAYIKVKPTSEPFILFNMSALYADSEAPIFITEGQIDAISIIEAGADAVSTSSTSGVNEFIRQLKAKPTKRPLIIAYDNDEAGATAKVKLIAELDGIGAVYTIAEICGNHSDPNEAYKKEKDTFIKAVQVAANEAADTNADRQYAEQSDSDKYRREHCTTTYITEFIQEIKDNKGIEGIPTGFTELDKVLDGGLYAGLYILGAISSLGKTTYALQMGDAVAASGVDVLIFSLEMSRKELVAKSLSRLSYDPAKDRGLSTRQILKGNFTDETKPIINGSIKAYRQFSDNLFITEGVGTITTDTVRAAVEKHVKATGNRPVVILDYVQIITTPEIRMTDKQVMDRAVFELKRLSRDFNIPVVIISSLNRSSYGKTITMSAFKESGAIEYSSDVLIGLQVAGMDEIDEKGAENFVNEKKNEYVRNIELRILKNRNGITGGKIDYEYIPRYNLFVEAEEAKPKKGKK
jgi:replicative DNA helicase